MKILVIKTSSMGDLVHCLPAITDIVNYCPGTDVHWLTEDAFADIAHMHPAVSKVACCATRSWRNRLLRKDTWQAIAQLRYWIRQQHYNLIIDFQGLYKSTFWILGSASESHGYDLWSAREPLVSFVYSKGHSVSKKLHAVERNRLLAAGAMGYDFKPVADFGICNPAPRKKQVVLLHSTSRLSKSLPVKYWQRLAQLFIDAGYKVLLPWYSDREREQASHISIVGGHLLNKMSIAELASHLSESQLVVAVDTGLAHLSCALNTPTLALFVSSNPTLTGVIGEHCLNLMSTEASCSEGQLQPVVEQVDRLQPDVIFQHAITLISGKRR